MDLQGELNWIHQKIDQIQDPQLIGVIKYIIQGRLSQNEESYIEEIGSTLSDYNRDLEEGRAEIKNEEYFTQEEIQAQAKKW